MERAQSGATFVRILNSDHIRAALPMPAAIDAMREAFAALSSGKVQAPLRTTIQTNHGVSLFMPAYLEGAAYGAVKMVGVYPDNAKRDLPTVPASVLVFDAETGQTRALLDGTFLTALRTGAASGLATDLLARPEAAVVGMIGAGGQARMQIEAICAVRPITTVRVYSRRGATAFCEQLATLFPAIQFIAASSALEAQQGADILVAVTTSVTPVIVSEAVEAGTHINGIGSYTPSMCEVDPRLVARARIVVDSRESALAEAGDVIIPIQQGLITANDIYAELGEIVSGVKHGRDNSEQITFFKSVGTAAQDAAAAARIVATAEAQNLGVEINF